MYKRTDTVNHTLSTIFIAVYIFAYILIIYPRSGSEVNCRTRSNPEIQDRVNSPVRGTGKGIPTPTIG
jgi:hypothetical protein